MRLVRSHPESQHLFIRKKSPQPLKANIGKNVIFGDSIPYDIRLREGNYWFHKGFAQLKLFPSGISKELPYYVEPRIKTNKRCL